MSVSAVVRRCYKRPNLRRFVFMCCLFVVYLFAYHFNSTLSYITTLYHSHAAPTQRLPSSRSDTVQNRIRIVIFDTSATNPTNLNTSSSRGAAWRTLGFCCQISVIRLAFVGDFCSGNIFGVNITLKRPWKSAVYKASREAYILGADYFLILGTSPTLPKDWSAKYIQKLSSLDPPNVGIIIHNGARIQDGHTFFHRTHLDIFGYVYPWYLKANSVYNYLYGVYPEERRLEVDAQKSPDRSDPDKETTTWIKQDRKFLLRYLDTRSQPRDSSVVKVISMSLYGNVDKYIQGAIRNAQLARLYFSDWRLRFYVPEPEMTQPKPVRDDVIRTLKSLDADIQYVSLGTRSVVPPMMWRFLVADDEIVDVFIIQDCDSRLGDRLFAAVSDWLMNTNATFHCMRDHPWHAMSVVSGGLWGARRRPLQRLLAGTLRSGMAQYNHSYAQDMSFLAHHVWPRVRTEAYCHDSVSCDRWPAAHPWTEPRRGLQHVGEIYNELHIPYKSNRLKLNQTQQHSVCEPNQRLPECD